MKDNNKVFERFYRRVAIEGIIKAVLCGIAAGFAVDFVLTLATWIFVLYKGLYFAIGAGLAVGVLCSVVMYFTKFRPNTKSIARRIDSLGLEERLITMTELEKDESYIAMRQKEDAHDRLRKFDAKNIRMAIAKPLIIIATIACVLGLSMNTVSALTEIGVLPPADVIFSGENDEDYVTIEYVIAYGEGKITGGSELQIIKRGENSEAVVAVPEAGWAFMFWSDGIENPERKELKVNADMVIQCIFVEVQPEEEGLDGQKQGKKPKDKQQQNDRQQNQAATDDMYDKSNQILDGETAYQHEYDNAREQMQEEFETNKDLSDKRKKALEHFLDTLYASGEGED